MNCTLANRNCSLSTIQTEFDAGRTYHPLAGRLNTIFLVASFQFPARECNSPCDHFHLWPVNCNLHSRNWKLHRRLALFNAGRSLCLPARRFSATYLGCILNFRSVDIEPIWKFQLPTLKCTHDLNPTTEYLTIKSVLNDIFVSRKVK